MPCIKSTTIGQSQLLRISIGLWSFYDLCSSYPQKLTCCRVSENCVLMLPRIIPQLHPRLLFDLFRFAARSVASMLRANAADY